jgi:hypothetical protein
MKSIHRDILCGYSIEVEITTDMGALPARYDAMIECPADKCRKFFKSANNVNIALACKRAKASLRAHINKIHGKKKLN